MFCNQCEQTAKGKGCTITGVCGKNPAVAALQDALLYAVKGLAIYANEARRQGITFQDINRFTAETIFATLTNVNFDPLRFVDWINQTVHYRERLKKELDQEHQLITDDPAANYSPATNMADLIKQGETIGLIIAKDADADIQSLQQLLLYGIKGIAAYAYHAAILGQEEETIYAFIHESLANLGNKDMSMEEWLALVLKCGEVNLKVMELLDKANTSAFGHPIPTSVPLGHKTGKCILVSGHDLQDLKDILQATVDTGINIYTHGEMLPAHGYPELKKYSHFYGHFGTAWHNQKQEFVNFPGPIVITTNCIQEPREVYQDNIFSTGPVGWPGIIHIKNNDYRKVIDKALAMPGFSNNENKGSVMVGFAHNTVLGVADQVIKAVKSGDLKHIFLVGGCDGARSGRSYYTEFVEKVPQNCLVLTLGCGKFRFFDKDLGDIGGIPRLLDMGQCNDAYSAIVVASALSKALDCDVNELPLTLVLSWYEQKAVSILLSLLYLGIKNIRIGPTLPAFISPGVLDYLAKNYQLKLVGEAETDLREVLK